MSFRELRDFTEMLRALGYPRMVSIDNFRQPNFPLVAEILLWLVKKFDANEMVPTDIEEQSDRIIFIKAMASFMAMKAHVKLSTKQLYKADGYAVRELLKITSLLYNADKQSKSQHDQGAVPVSLSDFDINTKLGDLKVCLFDHVAYSFYADDFKSSKPECLPMKSRPEGQSYTSFWEASLSSE
eukprot:TRINITY_DN12007_c6_g1_i4.p2 TRINITY_DN12007_c6_g1~~TRINITY_DN12007_c6_g1_i4.p2  ORF type:complete len:184 (+),score=27.90 TRINITY_DN12007_c6_g1_i4:1337-1888(+)